MDRIFDAYNGIGGFGKDFMRKTRERMKWICEQVSGASVLDVGCSQGVCPILLGRAGFKVLGLDINADAVAFANGQLLAEDESVRNAVQFVQGNFSTHEFGDRHFDNVIFGEVLEHLSRPEIFIEKAYSVLNGCGRVVITVPFGINDDPDHKQTFYFSKIKRIVHPYFEIKDIHYFGSWIGFLAIRREKRVAFVPTGDFEELENVENAVFERERQLRDRITQLLDDSCRQSESQKSLREQIATLSSQYSELAQEKEIAEKAKAVAENEIVQQKDQLERQVAEKRALEDQIAQNAAEKLTLGKQIAQLAADKQTLENRVARQAAERQVLEEQTERQTARQIDEVRTLEKQIAQLAADKQDLENRVARQTAEKQVLEEQTEQQAARQIAEVRTLAEQIAQLAAGKQALEDRLARQAAEKQVLEEQTEQQAARQIDEKRTLEDQIAQLAAEKRTLEDQIAQQVADNRKVQKELAVQRARANRAVSDYGKMKAWYERCRDDYKILSKAKLGRLTLWYWGLKGTIKTRTKTYLGRWIARRPQPLAAAEKQKACKAPAATAACRAVAAKVEDDVVRGVTVVIPTHARVAWLADAVKSVLVQKTDNCPVQIAICVNGPDKAYYKDLRREYSDIDDVEVLYTPHAGANAGRNVGIAAAKQEFLAFLDSDDLLTSGYLKSLLRHFADPEVNIVVGRLVDLDEKTGKKNDRTYVNSAILKLGMGPVECHKASPFLASFCMKVYRTAFVRDRLGKLDEGERHTEDVLFWARRFDRMAGKVYIADPSSPEAYVRRLTENSLSRPSKENGFRFYIVDRLAILDALQNILLNEAKTAVHKDFVLSRIKAQTSIMKGFFDGVDEETRRLARQKIRESRNLFLNKALFSDVEAIAFCHNFSPAVDPSAFVATKRLRMIDQEERRMLRWHVISQDMSRIRARDNMFKKYYADFACAEQIVLNEPFAFAPAGQIAFAEAALKAAERLPVPRVIYSRALFAGSHIAAYRFKKAHPEVKWYAEFSDPLAYGVDGKPRAAQGEPDWNDIEQMVYELADVIVFTNENQRDYMLSYNPRRHLNESIRLRSIIRTHPVIDSGYCKVAPCAYEMDESKINIGYFGTFYATRKCDDMLSILGNRKVVLHIFTTKPEAMAELAGRYVGQMRINNTVSHFEFMNLGSRMDYLILTDIEFPGEINPFLPSKFADYLVTGTPIIAKVSKGSVLSQMRKPTLLAVPEISEEFVRSLKKRRK